MESFDKHMWCVPFACRPLKDGDIVNVDVTVFSNGHHGDTNATFFVGEFLTAADSYRHVKKCTSDLLDKLLYIAHVIE